MEVPEIFARIYARHGHRCPMSTLGGRLGLAARAALGGAGDLRAVFRSRTCALDGIAEATGCSEADGSLRIAGEGRHSLTLASAAGSVEVELTEAALALAGRYRALCNRLEAGWDLLPADEQARRRGEMDAMLDKLLPQLWAAEDDLLLRRVTG